MRFSIAGEEYRIHFQHLRHMPPARKGERPRLERALLPHPSLAGVTLATIVTRRLIAQGIGLCVSTDGFCKEKGRITALWRAIERCRPLAAQRGAIMKAYFNRRLMDVSQPGFDEAALQAVNETLADFHFISAAARDIVLNSFLSEIARGADMKFTYRDRPLAEAVRAAVHDIPFLLQAFTRGESANS